MLSHSRRTCARISLLLVIVLCLSVSSPALAVSGPSQSVPWGEMKYEHYDPAPFKEKVRAMTAAAQAGETETVLELYDELYDEVVLVFTDFVIAEIHNSQDVQDAYWADEMVYSNTLLADLSDTLCTACYQLLESPCGDAFAAHVGDSAAQEFRDYEPMTARELELTKQETERISEYSAFMDKQNEVTYSYHGEEWTLERLDGEDGAVLRDDEYYDILSGIYDELSQGAADIFRQLVAIRTELAQIHGYDDYNQYAYQELRARDYTVEQAMTLFEEVKQIARKLSYSPVLSMRGDIAPTYDTQEDMLAVVHEYTSRVDPAFDEAWQFMTERDLCDIAVGPGRAAGAYTALLPAYDSAFIFSDDVGSADAMSTLFHEFGHFTAHRLAPPENYLTDQSILDLAEIHSTAMELLVLPFYDEIYEQGADIARYETLYNALCTVLDQALFAEFEIRVYQDPEAYVTAEDFNTLYNDISVEYGYPDVGPDPSWISIPHFFDSPNYVVSYVAAALAAIQVWSISREDWQAGVDVYMDIVRQGQYGKNYFQVLKDAGLKSFDTPGVASEVCGQVADALAALESRILNGGDDAEAPGEAAGDALADAGSGEAAPEDAPDEAAPEGPADVLDVETRSLDGGAEDSPREERADVLG